VRQRCEAIAIEFASGQKMYGWQSDSSPEVITLNRSSYENVSSVRTILTMWSVLGEVNPNVIFIPGYSEPLALAAALWGRIHRCTNVLMSDSTVFDCRRGPWKEKIKGRVTRLLFQKAFVSGTRSEQYLRSLNPQSLPLEAGYDVVDNAYFANRVSEIRSTHCNDRRYAPFLFVGRLVSAKDPHLLLEAYSAYRRKGGKRNLEIAGHGPLENSLKAFALENDLASCVKFCGLQAYSVLPELYARAGCLILPSNSEMWGLVVNEAMASGLPVIVSDRCGCVDELVRDGLNGFAFPASNSEALTDRMLAIDALNEPAREAMGRKSQQIIARLSPESWAEAVLRLAQGQSSCSAAA